MIAARSALLGGDALGRLEIVERGHQHALERAPGMPPTSGPGGVGASDGTRQLPTMA